MVGFSYDCNLMVMVVSLLDTSSQLMTSATYIYGQMFVGKAPWTIIQHSHFKCIPSKYMIKHVSEWRTFAFIWFLKLGICFQILFDFESFFWSPLSAFAFSAQDSRWHLPALRKCQISNLVEIWWFGRRSIYIALKSTPSVCQSAGR